MTKPNSKKQRALDCISRAQAEVGKALSLLGGKTRHKPKVLTRQYTARQYLESIDQRLRVTSDLVIFADVPWDVQICDTATATLALIREKEVTLKRDGA